MHHKPFSISDFQLTTRMSKRQKLSLFHFEGLPDEIILNIFSLLEIKEVLQCGQVSKRLRAISNDQSLWSRLNLFGREVPYSFIEKAVQNGCEYLNLGFSCVNGGKKSEVSWKLKYLEISQSDDLALRDLNVPKGLLENCHNLQKLAVDNLKLNSEEIEQICQNGETLRILSLEGCTIHVYRRTELLQKLFTKCHQLTELNISKGVGLTSVYGFCHILQDPHVCALVDNLTPNILKLNLGYQKCVKDKHVDSLVQKCNKITELNLSGTSITNDSIESIIKHLIFLEKLDVVDTNLDFSTLLQLKSIPTLKILRCFCPIKKEDTEKIKNLKLKLPQVVINEEFLYIACPRNVNGSIDLDCVWEIRAVQKKLFDNRITMSSS